jgi:hypothetical protein
MRPATQSALEQMYGLTEEQASNEVDDYLDRWAERKFTASRRTSTPAEDLEAFQSRWTVGAVLEDKARRS